MPADRYEISPDWIAAGRLAMLDRDDDAASSYVARIPEQDVQASWQLIEPTCVRLMHGPAGIRWSSKKTAAG